MMEEFDDGLDAANIAAAQDLSRQHYLGGEYDMPEDEYNDYAAQYDPHFTMPQYVADFLREFQDLIHRDVYVQEKDEYGEIIGYKPDPLVREQKLNSIRECYEVRFSSISDRFYKQQPWPHPIEQVAPLVENDDVFIMLYKELYFRHMYARLGQAISIEQRIESWENYILLFDRIFSDEDDMQSIDLPVQWLWDMVDEFVYQYQDFCRFRTKDIKKRPQSDIDLLASKLHVYDTMQVLGTLNRMVSQSDINNILREDKEDPDGFRLHIALSSEIGIAHVQLVLGYFSIVCMCRVHASCGDFHTALKSVENLDFKSSENSHQAPVYMRVTSCYITLYYFMGYSYMMMRRYMDAVRTMSQVVLYLSRTQHLTRPYQYEQLNKRSEQMYKLIAICISLCPQRSVEDSIMQYIQDKYSDQLSRLSKGEESMYEEFFGFAGPKAVYPGIPNYQDLNSREIGQTVSQQWNTFLADIRQQQKLPLIRSYLKLYTTLSTGKLASFAENMPEDKLRSNLLCLKHKTIGKVKPVNRGGSPLDGELASSSNVDFYLEKGVIHIADTRVAPTFAHYFTKHIAKLESLVSDLSVRPA